MTTEEMKTEVRTYCFNLIINSNLQDWDERYRTYKKDNMYVKMSSYNTDDVYFVISIYKDESLKEEVSSIEFKRKTNLFNFKEKKEIKSIRNKFNEIKNFFQNKKEYNNALAVYNLLPIRQIRKNKLKAINENEK